MNKKIGILTGGGDTQPLNAVIFFLRKMLAQTGYDFIGFHKGWEGVLENRYVDLQNVSDFHSIGGTILKSSRVNLATGEGFQKANQHLSQLGMDALVVIGGDDTLSNVYGIDTTFCIGVSKTIDNDVGSLSVESGEIQTVNYFTLGYPSAADKIARFVSLEEGVRTTAYSHERIIIVESMGMHAGWLAMASAYGKPDFIIIPEIPLSYLNFWNALKGCYAENRHAVIVIAEGARFDDGGYMHADSTEKDLFGNPRFGGASFVLRDKLKVDFKGFMDVRNINALNPSYLYRSGAPNQLDNCAALMTADRCFQLIMDDPLKEHQFVYLNRKDNQFEAKNCPFSAFKKNQQGRFPKRYIDTGFYDFETWSAKELWFEYADPIVTFRSSDIDYRLGS